MNRLGGRIAYGAAGKSFLIGLGQAVVAFCHAALNERHLAQVASTAALNERHFGRKTQTIYVAASRFIVKRVQHDWELFEIFNIVFDALK